MKPKSETETALAEIKSNQSLGLRTVLFTDMVGSTQLKQLHGDRKGVELILRHHGLVRKLLEEFPEGEEIGTAGDSFLLAFNEPVAAVKFALSLQVRLRELEKKTDRPLYDRIGIHLGTVYIQNQGQAAKPKDLFGIELDTCARVMQLAAARQILMTSMVFDYARPFIRGEELQGVGELGWYNYGPYQLKGLDEPVHICEVGEKGFSPLVPPVISPGVGHHTLAGTDPVAGWRPALGQLIPQTNWNLISKLGEGGFGEVWLGENAVTRDHHVFKFCFRAERVRSLKREATLFHVLREQVGTHPHIVTLLAVSFDHPPFYIQMEYVPGKDLHTWWKRTGEIGQITLETRLEIAAQAAEGLQAAHEAGVLHRDIKPGNILIAKNESGHIQVKLTDFGIGQVMSEEFLKDLTRSGFTRTIAAQLSSSPTGTQLYMAPEILAGKPASIRSDIFSLGVVVYQLLVGELTRPLATDWAREISDPLLREDLSLCFAGNPSDRFTSAGELARNIRALHQRRAEFAGRQQELARRERMAYRRGLLRATSIAVIIIGIISGLAYYARSEARRAKKNAVDALLAQAHSGRLSGLAGQRFAGLEAIEKAAGSARGIDVRNEAIACLALPDIKLLRKWPIDPAQWSALAFHPGMKAYARCGWDSIVSCRSTGNDLESFQFQMSRPADSLTFSRSGNELAAVCSDAENQILEVWSLVDERLLLCLTNTIALAALDFSPNSRLIALGWKNGQIDLINPSTSQVVQSFRSGAVPHSIRFSPDGGRIATCSQSSLNVSIFDLQSPSLVKTLRHPDVIHSVAWHPQGTMIAAGCGNRQIYIWHLDGELSNSMHGHQGVPNQLAFSQDGTLLVSSGEDKTLFFWDPYRNSLLLKRPSPESQIVDLRFSPDDRALGFEILDSNAQVFEVAMGKESRKVQDAASYLRIPQELEVDPSGRFLLVAHQAGVDFWDFSKGERLGSLEIGAVRSVLLHPKTGELLTSGFYGLHRFPFHVLPGDEQEIVEIGKAIPTDSPAGTGAMSVSSGGSLLALAAGDAVLLYKDLDFKQSIRLEEQPGLETVAVSPDDRWVASANWAKSRVTIWRADTGQFATNLVVNGRAHLAFSPEGLFLATSTETECRLWRVGAWEQGTVLAKTQGANRPVPVAFPPDGRTLAWGLGENSLRLFEIQRQTNIADLSSPLIGPLVGLKFSSGGGRILALSDKYPVLIWDLAEVRERLAGLNLDWELPPLAKQSMKLARRTLRILAESESLAQQHAFRELNRRLLTNAADAEAYLLRGQLHARRKEHDKAVTDFSRTLELMDSKEALLERALAWKELKEYQQAIGDFKRLQMLAPLELRAYRELASLFILGPPVVRNYQDGAHYALAALQVDPEDSTALVYAAVAHYRLGNYAECLDDVEQALSMGGSLQPNLPALCFKAMALAQLGNRPEAMAMQAKAETLTKRDPKRRTPFVAEVMEEMEKVLAATAHSGLLDSPGNNEP